MTDGASTGGPATAGSSGDDAADFGEREPVWGEPVPATVGAGRYRLGSLIGRGGSSEVFRARDALLGRAVAIKLFPAGSAGSGELRRWREVRTLAGLAHPRLVAVYDVGVHHGRAFFVMELIEGQNLTERLAAAGPLTLGQTLRLGGGLAGGLGYVHRHGVTHRDLKPANVLLDRADRPYLTDFGIATWIGAAALTGDGLILGTPAYLAPEQVRGQQIGPAADVYSLGLVLLECLTGRREYPGADVAAAATARLERHPAVPADLPDPVIKALHAMTHPQPSHRPDAQELVGYFAALLGSEAPRTLSRPGALGPALGSGPAAGHTGPRPAPRGPVTRGPAGRTRRRRGALTAAAGLALVLAASTGVAAAHTERPAAGPTIGALVADPRVSAGPGQGLITGPAPWVTPAVPAGPIRPPDTPSPQLPAPENSTPPLSDDEAVSMRSDSSPLDSTTGPTEATSPTTSGKSSTSDTSRKPSTSTASDADKSSGKSSGRSSTSRKSSGQGSGGSGKHDVAAGAVTKSRSAARGALREVEHASGAVGAALSGSHHSTSSHS